MRPDGRKHQIQDRQRAGATCRRATGGGKSAHKRFTRWAEAGVWERVFDALTTDRDNEYLMLDGTIVRAHQQAAARKGVGPGSLRGGRIEQRIEPALGVERQQIVAAADVLIVDEYLRDGVPAVGPLHHFGPAFGVKHDVEFLEVDALALEQRFRPPAEAAERAMYRFPPWPPFSPAFRQSLSPKGIYRALRRPRQPPSLG